MNLMRMKKLSTLLFLIGFLNWCFGQSYGDSLSIKPSAVVDAATPSITINWPADADATNFVIYRKAKGATSWGTALATLPGSTSTYTDLSVSINTLYDYKIQMTSGATPDKYGYLSSGIEVVANSNRGIAIVVVDDAYLGDSEFESALFQFTDDLDRDGWFVKKIFVNNADNASTVKSEIQTVYNEDPSNTKMLILVGNVAVPHSGNLNPDGHSDHQGAWPTDLFYADMNGNWTDASVNNTTSSNTLNHNIPGDGNTDQSYLPSDVELQTGRIDLSDLPAFSISEKDLLIRYFQKDHLYKTGQLIVGEQALIDDNFTSYAEGFSQSGYNNFTTMFGNANVVMNDYFTQTSFNTSTTGTYLWSYGCGGGTYNSAGGIGSATNFAADSLSAVFTMLFGSYFGDWDYSNAFLRAPLAQGYTLTNCWAGRPCWYFNHMSMGENIGYSTRLSQNNSSLYFSSTIGGLARMISINLMGDPSLRMFYIQPPVNLTVNSTGNSVALNWTAGGSEIGYNIYRRYADSTQYEKLNSSLITATNYTDNSLNQAGTVYYYVKAVEMKITASGSYENESIGAKDSAISTVSIVEEHTVELLLYPNPTSAYLRIENQENLIGLNYTITDQTGKIVLNGKLNNQSIDVRTLPAGVYVFTLSEAALKAVYFTKM